MAWSYKRGNKLTLLKLNIMFRDQFPLNDSLENQLFSSQYFVSENLEFIPSRLFFFSTIWCSINRIALFARKLDHLKFLEL